MFVDNVYVDNVYVDNVYADNVFVDKSYVEHLYVDNLYVDNVYADNVHVDNVYVQYKIPLDWSVVFYFKFFKFFLIHNSTKAFQCKCQPQCLQLIVSQLVK